MILTIDAGNSRLKWALVEIGEEVSSSTDFCERGTLDFHDQYTSVALEKAFRRLTKPDRIVVGSVAGGAIDKMASGICEELWGMLPVFLASPEKGWGITSSYADPGMMGVDRFAALVSAHARYDGPKLIVDSGSAVNIELLNAHGEHLGGMILPGLYMMRQALFEKTKKIPPMVTDTAGVFGRNTAQATSFGAANAVLGAIEIAKREALSLVSEHLTVLFTGGGAGGLRQSLGYGCFDDRLVLDGLARMGGFASCD